MIGRGKQGECIIVVMLVRPRCQAKPQEKEKLEISPDRRLCSGPEEEERRRGLIRTGVQQGMEREEKEGVFDEGKIIRERVLKTGDSRLKCTITVVPYRTVLYL
jgi:hypothetical protein